MGSKIFEFTEPVKEIETDILVAGAGPGGTCAAIAAARSGAKVLLVEQGNCAGGMVTQGLVGPFMTCYDKSGEHMIIRGLFEEVVDRMIEKGGAIHPSEVRKKTAYTSWIEKGHDHVTPFKTETLKLVLDEMLEEARVKVLYHTTFVQPVLHGCNIKGAIVFSKAGFEKINAKVVIDATGDADVAYRAGAACEYGNNQLGIVQPATMFFHISNVDSAKLEADIEANKDNFYRKDGVNYRSFHWWVEKARENGDWDFERTSLGLFKGVDDDEWFVNTSRINGVDATNNESLTYAEREGRKQADMIFRMIKKYVPGCENAKLTETASTIGIRESRHVEGDYRLEVDDILEGEVPEDSIMVCARQFASYEFVEEKSHIYGRIPIITVYNNEEQMSDLEKIETLVNDYDKVLSDVSNEFEAFRNAYLMLKNMTASGDNIQKLKDEGIIEVMENGDVKFITKEIQTEALENHLNRLEKNIHKFSAVPDLSDENFAGNLSGVAIRFKLFGLETKCIIKERKMEKAIKELVRVLSVPIHVNTGREVDVLNLKVEFSRNVPNNLTEIVDTVTKLDGKVDKETLLSLLPFIDNPKEVLEKLEADKERDRQSTDPYSTQNITEDSNNLFPNLNAQNSPQEALNAQGATIPQPEQ